MLPMETKGKEKALGGFGAGNGNNAVSLASIGDMREREMRRDRMNRSLGPPRLGKITGTPYFLLFLPSRIVHPLDDDGDEGLVTTRQSFAGERNWSRIP
jgi:hypothetical protein